MFEEPFPGELASPPELGFNQFGNLPSGTGIGGSGLRLKSIHEVPHEELGSPTTGDGVSRARKRSGKPSKVIFFQPFPIFGLLITV